MKARKLQKLRIKRGVDFHNAMCKGKWGWSDNANSNYFV